jgi:hypothetical protein
MGFIPQRTIDIRNNILKSLAVSKSVYDLREEFNTTVSAMKYHLNELEFLKLIRLDGYKTSPKGSKCFAYIGLGTEYNPNLSVPVIRKQPKIMPNIGISWTSSLSGMAS